MVLIRLSALSCMSWKWRPCSGSNESGHHNHFTQSEAAEDDSEGDSQKRAMKLWKMELCDKLFCIAHCLCNELHCFVWTDELHQPPMNTSGH